MNKEMIKSRFGIEIDDFKMVFAPGNPTNIFECAEVYIAAEVAEGVWKSRNAVVEDGLIKITPTVEGYGPQRIWKLGDYDLELHAYIARWPD